jgi:CubicO group peptidase (beta-lactamase class C family)
MKTLLKVFLLMMVCSIYSFGQIHTPDQAENFLETIKAFENIQSSSNAVYYDSTGLDSLIITIMTEYHFPGLSACIIKDDKVEWNRTFGYSNIAENKLVTDSTLFDIASVSKPVTATALMQLWEKDRFNLDDDINNYLPFNVRNPSFPELPLTFRMLLTHTSSIANNEGVYAWLMATGEDCPIPLETLLIGYLVPGGDYYRAQNWNGVAPGMEYLYTNAGVGLIGYLVEQISGIPFENYCQDSIFVPLGMNETSWFLSNLDENNIATPYAYEGNDYQAYSHWGWPYYPSAGLRTSVLQFARFLKVFMNNGQGDGVRILKSATVDSMIKIQDPTINSSQGLIWIVLDFNIPGLGNRLLCGHLGGVWNGTGNTIVAYILGSEDIVGSIIFTNRRSDSGINNLLLQLLSYGSLSDKIYPLHTNISTKFIQSDVDDLSITTQFVNSQNHGFNANAIIQSTDSMFVDSVDIFDDGQHGDGHAGDGVWGNKIGPVPEENEFILMFSTTDLNTGEYFRSVEVERFTSIGPVIIDSISSIRQSVFDETRFAFDIYLKNTSQVKTAQNISATIFPDTLHPCFDRTGAIYRVFGDIAPEGVKIAQNFTIHLNHSCIEDTFYTIPFAIEISSEDYVFWTDQYEIIVNNIPNIAYKIPNVFNLEQNYPNPFNPVTMINYQLPMTSDLELGIYNVLGQKVATLVNERQKAGYHQIEWDASGFASGIYYYRIEAGEFVDVKKMILLR